MSTAYARRGYAGGAVVTSLLVDITNAATSLSAVLASTFPAANFHIVIDEGVPGFEECIFVGTRTGNNFTVCTRGENGTTGVAHVAGATIRHVLVAQDLDEANSVTSVLTTKGDLAIKKAGGATTGWDRLPVGANGTLLVGRSGASLGVAYESLPAELLAAVQAGILAGTIDPRYLTTMQAVAIATANQTGITTAVDLTSLTITFTALASRRYRISCEFLAQSTVAGDVINYAIQKGGVQIKSAQTYLPLTAQSFTCKTSVVNTPGAGSVTYKVQASRAAGTGTLNTVAGALFPAELTVEDCGI